MNFLFVLFLAASLFAEEAKVENSASPSPPPSQQEGYTINYNTVSIVEYIRFASKICNVNFIFNEAELDFTVTVVSDAPIVPDNVMATLVQVLRIHGFTLLEQDNNLVIHKSDEVKQIASMVTDGQKGGKAPIVTRIFRVKNAKVDSVAAIIRPMISTAALLESSPETHQLILTDITANVDKVAALIEILDSPYTPLQIKSYEAQVNKPEFLIEIANQIMAPIAQGNPFILVSQPLANAIFIVSTPELVERAVSILTTLDIPPKKELLTQRKLKTENVFVYKAQFRTGDEILTGLSNIADNLQQSGIPEGDLVDTIDTARLIRETNSIMFFGSKDSLEKVKEFLASIDIPSKEGMEKSSFFIFKPQNRGAEEVEKAILEMANNLKGTKGGDESLIETIQSVKLNPSTNTLSFSGEEKNFPRIKELLTTIDTPTGKPKGAQRNNFIVYKIQQAPADEIEASLKKFAKNLDKSNASDEGLIESIQNMKYIEETNSILFTGPDGALKRLQEIVPSFDAGIGAAPISNQFLIYKPKFLKGDQLVASLKEIRSNLSSDKFTDPALLRTLESMKWVKATNSILFTGDSASIKKVEGIISTLDVAGATKPALEKNFFLYRPQYASHDKTESYLKQVADNLQKKGEDDLVDTIRSMKWIEPSQSFMFHGSDPSIARLKELLQSFDTPNAAQVPVQKGFFLYQLQHVSQQQMEQYLDQLGDNLSKKGGEEDLVAAIRSLKWVEASRSFMFHGNEASLNQLKELLKNFDVPGAAVMHKGFFLYHPQNASRETTESYLKQLADNLHKKGGEDDLVAAIRSMQWVEPSQSFMFQGSDTSIARIKELLQSFDTEDKRQKPQAGYAIYKVQNTTGDVIEEDLDSLVKNFQASGVKDTKLIDVIDNIRYVKETNSLLLTGDPQAIEEAKKLIAEYDYPRAAAAKGPIHSNFFMYKPQSVPATQIEKSLRDVGANLKKADLADPNLLDAIDSAKYVETTNSLIFTGSPEALQKIQSLIKDIDVPSQKHAPIQHIGKTSFLLYKLKMASGPQVISSIKAMTVDLKKSGASDKEFIAALQSVKYVKETNSLLFTGSEDALLKVEGFVEKFDVPSLAVREKIEPPPVGAPNFFVYKPQSLAGPDLEKILQDFAENLKMSGLSDPDLFNALNSMRWIEKTQSLVFTGNAKALDQIKQLLVTFDIPSNLPSGPIPGGALEPSIQAIDNTSFLVYKLQFHKGDEIQGALRQIAKDLILSNAPVNQNLLNSINSIQWLEVTNSLLCSGDQETLTRLRELIKNLDIPLKQVFIEMLVLQTTLTNALSFGLEWGGKYKYRDKFSGSFNNTNNISSTTGTCAIDQTMTNLNNLVPTTSKATPSLLPFGCGFDLGVIGQVIKHNGQTYLTLGSLLQALQTDDETTVIMTPKIITQDGRTSSIFVGENIPFVGSFVSNTGNNVAVQTANIEYRDIGLSLTVTPVLGNSDIVTLDISLDRTQTVGDITGAVLSNTTATGIVTSKTNMETTVHVPDKNFLILSGFVNNSNVKSKSGIPCLGGLPLVGAAFSKAGDTVSNSNIVIFLRPHIVSSVDDMRRITADQEDFFRDQAGTPFLEHNFNEGMELIKSIEDE